MGVSRTRLWLIACAASAVLLAVVVLLLARSRSAAAGQPPPVIARPPTTCDVPEPKLTRAHPDAEGPPVILWAEGDVTLKLDGRGAFSPPEKPLHLATGEHVLRIEAAGHQPIETKFRLDPFKPALFHAREDRLLGITLVRLGSVCTSCAQPMTIVELGARRAEQPVDETLRSAADALGADDWRKAQELLEQVPAKQRRRAEFRRLLSIFWAQAADLPTARELAAQLAELQPLTKRLGELELEEQERTANVVVARWNRLTEQHASLMRAVAGAVEAHVDVNPSSARMEELSAAFVGAMEKKDVLGQERVLIAAEETMASLLSQTLSVKKDDCAFRTRVAAALAGGAP